MPKHTTIAMASPFVGVLVGKFDAFKPFLDPKEGPN